MLTIPAIDLIEGSCVRLYKGDYDQKTSYASEPVEQALKFQSAGFKRIHVIDLEGARAGEGLNRPAIQRVLRACRVPVQIGGGIRTEGDVQELLDWGAEYLILGTVALDAPDTVSDWVAKWGPERFILSLDLRNGRLQTEGWLGESQRTLEEVVGLVKDWGLSQVISTDVERDGTMEQPKYSTYSQLQELLPESVRLIAAGGVCAPDHLKELKRLGLFAAIVGRAMYEGEYSWEEMRNAG